MDRKIHNILSEKVDKKVVSDLVNGLSKYKNTYESQLNWDWCMFNESWTSVLKNSKIVEEEQTDLYKTVIESSDFNVLSLPTVLTKQLLKQNNAEHIYGSFAANNKSGVIIDNPNEEEKDFLVYIKSLIEKFIFDFIYEDIKLYKPINNRETVTSFNNTLYVSIYFKKPSIKLIKELLTKIIIEQHYHIKYKDKRDGYGTNVDIELAESILKISNRMEFFFVLESISNNTYLNLGKCIITLFTETNIIETTPNIKDYINYYFILEKVNIDEIDDSVIISENYTIENYKKDYSDTLYKLSLKTNN
jgi:hypothetical protein